MKNRIADTQEIEYEDYLLSYVLMDILEENLPLQEYWANTPDHTPLYPENHPDVRLN